MSGIYLASARPGDTISPPASIAPNLVCPPVRSCLDNLTSLGRGILTQDSLRCLSAPTGMLFKALAFLSREHQGTSPDTMGAESFHPASPALSSLLLWSAFTVKINNCVGWLEDLQIKNMAGEMKGCTALNWWSKDEGFQVVPKVSHGISSLRLLCTMGQGGEKAEVDGKGPNCLRGTTGVWSVPSGHSPC